MVRFSAHDFLWVHSDEDLIGEVPDWVHLVWNPKLPLVCRRDSSTEYCLLPVGIRGRIRKERCALWINENRVARRVTPRDVVALLYTCSLRTPAVQGARFFAETDWPFYWGITGSCAYSLVTGTNVMHRTSDLDLVIRSASPLRKADLRQWVRVASGCMCRTNTQIDTGVGAFSLNEWMQSDTVLLKTNQGPRLVRNPWEGVPGGV